MFKIIFTLSLFLAAVPSRADLFGGDVVVLSKILLQSLDQLSELKKVVETGQQNIELIKQINQGMNDSLNLVATMGPESQSQIYRNLKNISDVRSEVESHYGKPVSSPMMTSQENTDQVTSEAIALNNSVDTYTKNIDQVGDAVKTYSHAVSPGGAQRLTAQSLGVMLHVQSETLRTLAMGLKLQAQSLAIQNQKEKEKTRLAKETSESFVTALNEMSPDFSIPRL